MVWVELLGPPLVSGMMMSNSCSAPTMAKNIDTTIDDQIIGILMWRMIWPRLTPSSRAASITSLGIDCRPAM